MPVSIHEVAQEAGVSVSTVSKVLNHSPLISEATTQKVRSIMEQLHYRPNLRAQNFARQKTHNVTFIARAEKNAAFNNPHLFEIMCGVENTLSGKGYSLTFINLTKEQDEGTVIESLIEQKNTDGSIQSAAAWASGSACSEAAGRKIRKITGTDHTALGSAKWSCYHSKIRS
jgi:DNA-binding LacI/PurR family transcriptional regulator